ncbi:hypothetical protein WG901_16480 [Novosphingobium sp. PS1R-30]|uniref:Transcriptional regulator n=1 Tax=Novosphingobium anseongense TaxID=3133436 RepID=A0ABU8RYU4_9SPHN
MDMTVSSRAFDLGHQKCGKLAEHLSRIGDRWTLPVVVTLREALRASTSSAETSRAFRSKC